MVTSYHPTITFGEVIGEVLLNTYHAFSPLSVGLSDLLGEYVRSFSKNYFICRKAMFRSSYVHHPMMALRFVLK